MPDTFQGPLFIVGMPRSGTKLLRDLLNQHPRIAIPTVETEFLPYLVHNIHRYGALDDRGNFEIFYERITRFPFFTYMRELGSLPAAGRWYDTCPDFTPQGIFEGLVRVCTGAAGVDVIWGDKSPSYINHVSMLKKLYTEARFIHIVRDARDYALSMNKAWGKNLFRAAQRWEESIEAFGRQVRTFTKDVLELRYEDLVRDPGTVLQGVCDFLDIAFTDQMLVLPRATENIGDTRGQVDIVSGNIEKYRTRLDPGTSARIERLAAPMLKKYGYETSAGVQVEKLGAFMSRYYQLLDGINLVVSETSNRGLLGSVLFYARYFVVTRK